MCNDFMGSPFLSSFFFVCAEEITVTLSIVIKAAPFVPSKQCNICTVLLNFLTTCKEIIFVVSRRLY